ncbi:MAG: pantoate--beta-alanine ligase [Dehalococcoidia bacterium]|nr:pantoate--beta-alanine ligase [Dehalococcoidia bacterium]
MKIARTIEEFRALRRELPGPVGLFPTLGALHEGHLALIERARGENASVVTSLFVNPTQFGPNEDFSLYPRDEERDCRLFREAGVNLVFVPSLEEMYPAGFDVTVRVGGVTERLEGERRPGHFDGVATIVAKIFTVTQPDRAYFGEKDGQQLLVIRKLVRDLNLPVEIVACPTVRDPDGLALSSRNAYLSPEEREQALSLSRGLRLATKAFADGERGADALRRIARREIEAQSLSDIDYVALADAETLAEVEGEVTRPALLLVAVRFGKTRLIDNARLTVD